MTEKYITREDLINGDIIIYDEKGNINHPFNYLITCKKLPKLNAIFNTFYEKVEK